MSGPNFAGLDKGFAVAAAATGVDFGLAVMYNDAAGKQVKLPTGPTVFCVGVAQDTIDDAKIATGKAVVNVRMFGITRAVAGAAITVGSPVMVQATGKFITATTPGTNLVAGYALSPASADGDHFNLFLVPAGLL